MLTEYVWYVWSHGSLNEESCVDASNSVALDNMNVPNAMPTESIRFDINNLWMCVAACDLCESSKQSHRRLLWPRVSDPTLKV